MSKRWQYRAATSTWGGQFRHRRWEAVRRLGQGVGPSSFYFGGTQSVRDGGALDLRNCSRRIITLAEFDEPDHLGNQFHSRCRRRDEFGVRQPHPAARIFSVATTAVADAHARGCVDHSTHCCQPWCDVRVRLGLRTYRRPTASDCEADGRRSACINRAEGIVFERHETDSPQAEETGLPGGDQRHALGR